MKKRKRSKNKKGQKRGPKAEMLKFEMDWADAIKRSFLKKRPEEGWPKE